MARTGSLLNMQRVSCSLALLFPLIAFTVTASSDCDITFRRCLTIMANASKRIDDDGVSQNPLVRAVFCAPFHAQALSCVQELVGKCQADAAKKKLVTQLQSKIPDPTKGGLCFYKAVCILCSTLAEKQFEVSDTKGHHQAYASLVRDCYTTVQLVDPHCTTNFLFYTVVYTVNYAFCFNQQPTDDGCRGALAGCLETLNKHVADMDKAVGEGQSTDTLCSTARDELADCAIKGKLGCATDQANKDSLDSLTLLEKFSLPENEGWCTQEILCLLRYRMCDAGAILSECSSSPEEDVFCKSAGDASECLSDLVANSCRNTDEKEGYNDVQKKRQAIAETCASEGHSAHQPVLAAGVLAAVLLR